jgi:hypothetical protein
MKDGIDNDGVCRGHVENFTRKAPKEGSSKLIHSHGIEMRVPFYGENAGFHTAEKVLPESWFLALIPVVRQCHILVGVCCKNDMLNHVEPVPAA